MSYINLTYATIDPVLNYIDSNWCNKKKLLKTRIFTRGAHLLLIPPSFIISAIDIVIGLGAGIGAVCTLGKHRRTFIIARDHLSMSNNLFLAPYWLFLFTLNPKAAKLAMITREDDSFLSDSVITPLKKIARTCYNSDNFLKRHVSSRLTYALLAISCLVTRVADGVIAIPTAGLSILTGGKFVPLNNLAFRTLQAPSLIDDLFYCTIKFINPWTGKSV